jgi:hypothetical protein
MKKAGISSKQINSPICFMKLIKKKKGISANED